MITLTNEQVDAIRARDAACRGHEYGDLASKPSTAAYRDRHVLLAYVDQLRQSVRDLAAATDPHDAQAIAQRLAVEWDEDWQLEDPTLRDVARNRLTSAGTEGALECPRCGEGLIGPCGDSAWSRVWVYMCSDVDCSVEVSIEAEQAPSGEPAT